MLTTEASFSLLLDFVIPPHPLVERGSSYKFDIDPSGTYLIYSNGRNIYLRKINGANDVKIYRGHSHQTTVAKCSPNGEMIASGDVCGNIKVWYINSFDSHMPKLEKKLWSGKILDIAWDADSSRLFVVGDGGAVAFNVETGASLGDVSLHSKQVNTVSIGYSRPVRAMTGSDDFTAIEFTGIPFKFHKTFTSHVGFVQQIAYSPCGQYSISVSSDKQAVLYRNGNIINAKQIHSGAIYGVCWLPILKKQGDESEYYVATCSGDKSVKIFSVPLLDEISSLLMKDQICGISLLKSSHQHLLVTLSLQGEFSFISPLEMSVCNSIQGHRGGILQVFTNQTQNSLLYSVDKSYTIFNHPSQDSSLFVIKLDAQKCYFYKEEIAYFWEGKLNFYKQAISTYHSILDVVGFCGGNGFVFYATKNNFIQKYSIDSQTVTASMYVSVCEWNEFAVKLVVDDNNLCVASQSQLLWFNIADLSLVASVEVNYGTPECIAISPNSKYVAIGMAERFIRVYSMDDTTSPKRLSLLIDREWIMHSAAVKAIQWDVLSIHHQLEKTNERLFSASADGTIIQWDLKRPKSWEITKNAHSGSINTLCIWENLLVSGGEDGCIKYWNFVVQNDKK